MRYAHARYTKRMTSPAPPPRPAADKDTAPLLQNEGGIQRHSAILARLTPFLWPVGDSRTRTKICLMVVFLLASVFVGVYAPLLLKDAVDRLAGDATDSGVARVVALPLGLILAYGFARLTASFFSEIRRFLFARVAQSAVRRIAVSVFEHLMQLNLAFHLDRRTGGLSRVIERGVKSIEFLLEFMLFNILPTLVQIVLIAIVLWGRFSFLFAVLTVLTIGGYIFFTLVITEWRLQFRREMNYADNDAHGKAIDSLLNFETVKYFGNEAHESQRLDIAFKNYENAAVKSLTSLSYVNLGQAAIIALGLVVILTLASRSLCRARRCRRSSFRGGIATPLGNHEGEEDVAADGEHREDGEQKAETSPQDDGDQHDLDKRRQDIEEHELEQEFDRLDSALDDAAEPSRAAV